MAQCFYSESFCSNMQFNSPSSGAVQYTVPLQSNSSSDSTTSHAPSPESPPFNAQETYGTITCEGTTVVPTLDAKIGKGFFYSNDCIWTCYRRNYLAVNVSHGLSPWISNSHLYLDQGNGNQPDQIQSMAVSLAAAVDGSGGKTIKLIQHTPKRDKGPLLSMKKELLAPTPPGKSHEHYGLNNFHQSSSVPGPQLPLQNKSDSSQQYSPTSHAGSKYKHDFERIQFRLATPHNGRTQQQYYCLIVELWANIQNPRDNEPKWVKVAARSSQPVVVRGRSPSHYQHKSRHNSDASLGAGESGLSGPGLGSYSAPGFGSYSNGLSNGGATMGGNSYRGNTHSLDPSPIGSHYVKSASSFSGGPYEGLVGDQHMVDPDRTKTKDCPLNYGYYLAPPYQNTPTMDECSFPLTQHSISKEYPVPATLAAHQYGNGCSQSQSLKTSCEQCINVYAPSEY